MPKKSLASEIYILPLLFSGNIRKEVIPRIEKVIRTDLENNIKQYILFEASTFKIVGDDLTVDIHTGRDLTSYVIRLVSITLNSTNGLANLLKNDYVKKEHKAKELFDRLHKVIYRKLVKKLKLHHTDLSVLWNNKNTIAILDVSDLDKCGLTVSEFLSIAKTLQKRYSWPNIALYIEASNELQICFKKQMGTIKKILL